MITYSKYRPTGYDTAGLNCDDQQDWLVAPVGQNRDSDALDRSNFAVALRMLDRSVGPSDSTGEVDNDGDHEVHRFGHWACGWFEIILVRPGSRAAELMADAEARLADYPILCEDHFSDVEREDADEAWRNCYQPVDRIAYIRRNRNQFEFRTLGDILGCVRGHYFAGDAAELLS
jgi:hypothetical protein